MSMQVLNTPRHRAWGTARAGIEFYAGTDADGKTLALPAEPGQRKKGLSYSTLHTLAALGAWHLKFWPPCHATPPGATVRQGFSMISDRPLEDVDGHHHLLIVTEPQLIQHLKQEERRLRGAACSHPGKMRAAAEAAPPALPPPPPSSELPSASSAPSPQLTSAAVSDPSDPAVRLLVRALQGVEDDAAQHPAWVIDMALCRRRLIRQDVSFAEVLAQPDDVTQCWWALKHFEPPTGSEEVYGELRATVTAAFREDCGDFADACTGEVMEDGECSAASADFHYCTLESSPAAMGRAAAGSLQHGGATAPAAADFAGAVPAAACAEREPHVALPAGLTIAATMAADGHHGGRPHPAAAAAAKDEDKVVVLGPAAASAASDIPSTGVPDVSAPSKQARRRLKRWLSDTFGACLGAPTSRAPDVEAAQLQGYVSQQQSRPAPRPAWPSATKTNPSGEDSAADAYGGHASCGSAPLTATLVAAPHGTGGGGGFEGGATVTSTSDACAARGGGWRDVSGAPDEPSCAPPAGGDAGFDWTPADSWPEEGSMSGGGYCGAAAALVDTMDAAGGTSQLAMHVQHPTWASRLSARSRVL